MQPLFPYKPEGYPPRGRMWPQWGDEALEDTLSVAEGARQSLNKKRENMKGFHQDYLQQIGYAAPPSPIQDVAPADPLEMRLNNRGDDAPPFPRLQRGVGGNALPSGAVHYGNDDLPFETPDYPMEPQRASVTAGLGSPEDALNLAPSLRARESFRSQPSNPGGLMTQATPQYAVDMPVDQLGDSDVANRVDKRMREVKEERKMKIKAEPQMKIKQEGERASQPSSSPSAVPEEEEDLQTVGVNFNNNTDMAFWEQASANELKSQLNLRFPEKKGDWQLKSRPQLISYVRGLIRKGQWVQGGGPARSSSSQNRAAPYPWPASSAAPAAQEEDDVEVGPVTWDKNQDPEYWAQQSANYIRQQLTARFPTQRERHAFAFLETRQEYIDYIIKLIREGKW